MTAEFRPFPDDATAGEVEGMLEIAREDWILLGDGEFQAAAVQAFQSDGSHVQHLIALAVPGRRNHTDEKLIVRLMIGPHDAAQIGEYLIHAGRWLQARAQIVN